jgi:hypothetical protein
MGGEMSSQHFTALATLRSSYSEMECGVIKINFITLKTEHYPSLESARAIAR